MEEREKKEEKNGTEWIRMKKKNEQNKINGNKTEKPAMASLNA